MSYERIVALRAIDPTVKVQIDKNEDDSTVFVRVYSRRGALAEHAPTTDDALDVIEPKLKALFP